jgi:RNA polymerase sigma-70 factor (TIGR02960 family)
MTDTFTAVADRHRRELHVHCYRMLGSFEEAEDLVQETYLRAWKNRDQFDGDHLRAWLYKIATNACLDKIRRDNRRVPSLQSIGEVPWLQPYPDRLLDEIAPSEEQPDQVVVEREGIELAFLLVIQHLPARQRAALVLRDLVGWSAAQTAEMLDTSVASVNSALQRARATLDEHRPHGRTSAPPPAPTDYERELLEQLIAAHEANDGERFLEVMREDIRIAMPPIPEWFEGIEKLRELQKRAFDSGMGEWRLVATSANRMPAAASYLRAPGSDEFVAFKIDVLRIEDGLIAEITTFNESLFEQFGLPLTLSV